jgi:hypothetical protein
MNTGIQDGYNLAWKLARVISGNASSELLSTYNEERLPNAETLTKTTDRMFGFAASPEPLTTFTRLHLFPYIAQFLFSLDPVKRFIFPRISQIGINYEDDSLSKQTGAFKIKAGDRMPWFMVDGRSIYDELREPRFHLLTFKDGRTPSVEVPATEFDSSVDVHSYSLFPHVAEIFGVERSFLVLLRPDNYIGLISDDLSHERIREYMNLVSR